MQITGDLNDEYLIMSKISRHGLHACKSVQIVANIESVTGFAIDLQTRKPNISPGETFAGMSMVSVIIERY